MVSRRAPELAWTSWTDFWSDPCGGELVDIVAGLPMSVFMTVLS